MVVFVVLFNAYYDTKMSVIPILLSRILRLVNGEVISLTCPGIPKAHI